MGKRTPFYDFHVKTNAKIVDFAGWDMPLHYGSQLEEHHQVRQHAGIFDVSHMGVVDLLGSDVKIYLERLLANDVNKLANGKALYTCMLNEQGGVLDDLIVYKINDDFYRVIVNAGTRQKDIAWMREQTHGLDINILERVDDAMFAVQGPEVKNIIDEIFLPEQSEALKALKPFNFLITNDTFIARTGYTGEDGYEIITSEKNAVNLWESFVKAGVKPCGLGSRDTLRLEAGLNLYGSDMDESVTPLESNLAWTVTLEPQSRDFIGRKALEKIKDEGVKQRLVGLVLEGPGIIRNHQRVLIKGNGEGVVTSGGYSPTLEKSIALARIPNETEGELFVEIRNKQIPAKVIKPPFVRNGKKLV